MKRSHNVFQVFVQFLSSGSDNIHSSGIEVLDLVTKIVQVGVKGHELVLRLPISNDLFRCVNRLINLLISLKNSRLNLWVPVVLFLTRRKVQGKHITYLKLSSLRVTLRVLYDFVLNEIIQCLLDTSLGTFIEKILNLRPSIKALKCL